MLLLYPASLDLYYHQTEAHKPEEPSTLTSIDVKQPMSFTEKSLKLSDAILLSFFSGNHPALMCSDLC